MEYRKIGDTIVLCLMRGEEVLASIRAVCNAEQVRLAEISALGAADHAEIGVYQLAERRFLPRTLEGEMEICALTGNVTRCGDELYLHLHGSLADAEGRVYGGHVNEIRISATAEIFIRLLPGEINRRRDGELGIFLMDFNT
ncbi:MAG: DNA-binding protein [Clostridiales bacterium]|nr:DNA-binding protein [Clostridiales bacterium]